MKTLHTFSRRAVLAGMFLPMAAATPSIAHAQTGASDQPPTFGRFRIGAIQVTAVSDGFLQLPPDLMVGLSSTDYADLLDRSGFRGNVYTGGVTAYLVETEARRIMIDAGTGPVMGPTLGRFSEALVHLGWAPESIDTIIVTHLHPDHIGGLLQGQVSPFTQAELVIHAADRAFWTDNAIKAQFPTDFQGFFDLAAGVLAVFQDRLRIIETETEIAPGLTAVPLPGHTPGHMGVRLNSGPDTVLMWGDIVHAAPIQIPSPGVAVAFDVDPAAAVATRWALFDQVATDRLYVLGSHLPFPSFGMIERRADGYGYVPAHWEYV